MGVGVLSVGSGAAPHREEILTMRRLLATAAGSAVLLLGAGCSTGPDATDDAASGAPASAPPGSAAAAPGASGGGTTGSGATGAAKDGVARPGTPAGGATAGQSARARSVGEAALAGNTIAICDQATKISGTAAATFATDLKVIVEASSAGDKARLAKAKEKARRNVENWSFALGDMSKLVADPGVKKALADMSRSVGKLRGDLTGIDPAKLDGLRTKLDKACGKG
jgi:hypothetical protein